MEIAKIEVGRTTGVCTRRERIPAGIAGASVQVSFTDPVWDSLIKTVVFRGKETRIAEFDGAVAEIPHEVIPEPRIALYFGIFGHDPDKDLQIPLIEVYLGTTEKSTDANADPGADPTLPIWAQLQQDIEKIKQQGPGSGGNAEDGFSPIATVTQTDSGAVISITDKTGTTTATIANGKDGKDGADGQPGKDGADGAPGEKGDKGDKGDPGEPGQKGEKGDTGAPGADGAKGDKGDKGDTGATGAQGDPGKDGANGKDGTSATHSWNGTVLTITSASGTSSADLKGAKGDKGDKGDTGAAGKDGANGKDYVLTDADKSEIAESVKSAIGVPDAVVTEASRVVDTALTREDSRIFRFLAVADAHQKNEDYYSAEITAGTKELGQAVGEVLRQIGVDFVANLGDTTWGASESSSATVLEEAKAFNKMFTDSIRGETQIWTEGNHETDKLSDSQIYSLIYSHNKGLTQDADHWIEGYGYMDFPNQKVRIICLNTNQGAPGVTVGVSDAQLRWFAEIALNMDEKLGWSVLTIGHHPLGYSSVSLSRDCVGVLETFIKEGNCQYIGHFHGHVHSYTINRIRKYVSSGVYEEIDAWEVCIPNACATRTDQYAQNVEGDYLRAHYSVGSVDYNRPTTDGKRTAFAVVTICLDEKKIYADDYGIVPPNVREVSYDFTKQEGYTNLLPEAKDADGVAIYGGDYNGDGKNDGYKTDTYLSSADAKTREGVETTGFIPFDGSGNYVIYLSGITAKTTDGNFRLNLYNSSKALIAHLTATLMGSNEYAPIAMTSGADGNITMLDCNAFVAAWKGEYGDNEGNTPEFFRLCAPHIDGNSIITVNQPIE